MQTQWETVLYEKAGKIGKIIMNRPEYRNAQNTQMTRDLDAAFMQAADDDEVAVIILSGNGPHFSSGHDLGSPQALAERAARAHLKGVKPRLDREQDVYIDCVFRWRDISKPTIAMVHGACIAGGNMLAACCDIIIASEDARFSDPVVKMGVGGVEYFFHPWDLGPRKAKEWLFTGDFMPAQEAWRLGYVNRVVPRDKLEEETMALANKIAEMPTFGLQLAKMSINDTMDIMGFRNSILNTFKAHHLAHGHAAELTGGRGTLINLLDERKKEKAEEAKQ